jgi:molybdenum cofactor synthesis domain-containing protein
MIPLDRARELVLSGCPPLGAHTVRIDDALGRVAAGAVVASEDLPPFANSAMDGYAVRSADTLGAPVELSVAGAVMAGDPGAVPTSPGQAVRIMTGAPLPAGLDAVCMIERTQTSADGRVVRVEEHVAPGNFVRPAGDDVPAGSVVVPDGDVITAAHLGLLARLGVAVVAVRARPRVGIMSTGDEVVEGAAELTAGHIRDGNRPALLALVRREGWEAVDLGIVGDDAAALTEAFAKATTACDALITSGGVSVGDLDVVKEVLTTLAGDSMHWLQVAIRPAKPFAFGLLDDGRVPVFGLPGNPVSSIVSFELFARPALRQMAGEPMLDRPRVRARLEAPIGRQTDGKLHLVRVRATLDGEGTIGVMPLEGQGSHQLSALAEANALALVPDGSGLVTGDIVETMLLDTDRLSPEGAVPFAGES